MANHHLKNRELTLKAKGLMSVLLSLPDDWDYTLAGLARISREGVDAIPPAWKLPPRHWLILICFLRCWLNTRNSVQPVRKPLV